MYCWRKNKFSRNKNKCKKKIKKKCRRIKQECCTFNQNFANYTEDEKLYIETCVQCLNLIGKYQDDTSSIKEDALISYLNEVFDDIDDERIREFYDVILQEELPPVILQIHVIEAKNLPPMDANGLCDPFCVMWISSKSKEWVKSTIISKTLNPHWNESYELCTKSMKTDTFNLSVWDKDAVESVGELMKTAVGIKTSCWACVKCVNEFKHSAFRIDCNEIIGSINIPLKNIQTTGQKTWFRLQKSKESCDLGSILLQFTFRAQKCNDEAFYKHKRLYNKIVLKHIEKSSQENTKWSGELSELAQIILGQHFVRSNLTYNEQLLIRWMICVDLHDCNNVDVALIVDILDDLILRQQSEDFLREKAIIDMFCDYMKKLSSLCFQFIKELSTRNRKEISTELQSILRILQNLHSFVGNSFFGNFANEQNSDIKNVLQDTVITGACYWFSALLKRQEVEYQINNEDMLKVNIDAVVCVNDDLEYSFHYNENIFKMYLPYSYSKVLFIVYQYLVCEAVKPVIIKTLIMMKSFNFIGQDSHQCSSYFFSEAASIFKLYLELERLYNTGIQIFGAERKLKSFEIFQFRDWFFPGVTRWIDIMIYEARQYITKAVELDELVAIDDSNKCTCSAVETVFIFHKMKVTWQRMKLLHNQLHMCIFVIKIIDAIAECFAYYANKLKTKLQMLNDVITQVVNKDDYQFVNKFCFAINNIYYIYKNVHSLLMEFGCENIVADIYNDNGEEYDRSITITNLENPIDPFASKLLETVLEKRNELSEKITLKVLSVTMALLRESACSLHLDCRSMDAFMDYLENSLIQLDTKLHRENFEYILPIIWKTLYQMLYNSAEYGIKEHKPPKFFSNLNRIAVILVDYFEQIVDRQTRMDDLNEIKKKLHFYEMETTFLIYRYYQERYEHLKAIDKPKYGSLAVCVTRTKENTLEIDLVNGRNIKPMDSNGYCDPFVIVELLPSDTFNWKSFRTKVKRKTLFPLFEEKFVVCLPADQGELQDAMIMFTVEDEDLCGLKNDYVGECYLPFHEINKLNGQQTVLNLHRPSTLDSEILNVLCGRQSNDPIAKQFIKMEKMKMASINLNN